MDQKAIGRSGRTMSAIALGSSPFGREIDDEDHQHENQGSHFGSRIRNRVSTQYGSNCPARPNHRYRAVGVHNPVCQACQDAAKQVVCAASDGAIAGMQALHFVQEHTK